MSKNITQKDTVTIKNNPDKNPSTTLSDPNLPRFVAPPMPIDKKDK
jgi:hypothetical protein